jgi:cell division protein FtsQ
MARSRSKRKAGKPKTESKKTAPLKIPIQKILRYGLVFAAVPSFYVLAKNSTYFDLANVRMVNGHHVSNPAKAEIISLYKGRNIFEIDINAIAGRIKNRHPVIKSAVVRRILPDTLEIYVIPRVPVAIIQGRENFPVDRTGMVLPPLEKPKNIPIITGLSIWLNPRIGEKIETKRLGSAFLLIDALGEVELRSEDRVVSIDASNYRNLSAYLKNGIEVKIGDENFSDRLIGLRSTLENSDLNKENIRYIDLRFRDVVIGPK